jgi:hypothetical protein
MDTTKRRGKCINFGNCTKADRKEIIDLDFTEDFVCPECNGDLIEEKAPPGPPVKLILIIAATVLVLGGGAAAFFLLKKPAVKEIVLSASQLDLKVDETHTLTYTVVPENAPAENFVWSSSNRNIATVSKGVVTAKSAGEVQITVSTPDRKISAQCAVTVSEQQTPPPPGEDGKGKDGDPGENVASALNKGHVEDNGSGSGTISTPSGKYTGDIKDGKANGNGVFQFFINCRISRHDDNERVAESGDYIVGQFENNEVIQVKWLDKDKNQKGVIIIGSLGIQPK